MMTFKKPIIIILLSLTTFSFSNCGNAKAGGESITFQQNPPFTIEGVTIQKTIAGTKEGGTSTTLSVPVNQAKEGVVFKDLFYNGQRVSSTTNPKMKGKYLGYFKGDNNDFIMDSDPIKEAENTPRTPLSFNLKGNEAVFSYEYQGRLSYYKITAITELDPIMLPAENPNQSNGLNN